MGETNAEKFNSLTIWWPKYGGETPAELRISWESLTHWYMAFYHWNYVLLHSRCRSTSALPFIIGDEPLHTSSMQFMLKQWFTDLAQRVECSCFGMEEDLEERVLRLWEDLERDCMGGVWVKRGWGKRGQRGWIKDETDILTYSTLHPNNPCN